MRRTFAFVAAFAALPVFATAQLSLVAPNGYATAEGNSNNAYPWNRGTASMRIQFVYDSTNFTLGGVTAPVLIQNLRFRPDGALATSTWAGGTWPNVQIDMAHCATDYLAVGTSFAANMGAGFATVLQGPVTVQAGTATPPGPAANYIDIALTTPFLYDPNQGDLIMDIQLDGTGWSGTGRATDNVSSTGTPPPLGTRIYSTASHLATTGTIGLNYVAVCEFGFVPANGLFASFSASPTGGGSPLTVQFTDQSYSSAPTGVVAWQWDLNGDSVIDSNAQHPSFVYTGCGDYTVSLTVLDGINPPATLTRTAFVRTDVITASFTTQPLGGGVWQCTDTTTPTPTAWAWDFDGDGIADSTAQNPTVNFGNDCSGSITLQATRNCRTSSRTQAVLQAAGAHSANLAGGTGTTATPTVGNLFDVQVLAPEGILVCGLTSATYTGSGPYTVSVYVTAGSYVGKDTTASQWRLVGRGTGTMNGGGTATPSLNQIVLEDPFYLPAGDYGVAVWHTSASGASYLCYTNASSGPFAGTDLVIHPAPATAPGIARTGLFAGGLLSPRQWNGTFHYTKVSMNAQGGYGVFGLGCPGSLGVPGNVVVDPPAIGTTMAIDLTNLATNVAMYWWGFSNTTSAFGPLPVDLSGLGAPGCFGRVSLDASVALVGTAGTARFQFPLPNNPTLLGVLLYAQALSLDPAANALGLVASDAAGFIVGQ